MHDFLVKLAKAKLDTLPPITVYEPEEIPEDLMLDADKSDTVIKKVDGKYTVEGEWLYNLMGRINFSDYESLSYFQRVLIKNGVIDALKEEGVKEGDTVSIFGFEFDFVF